MTQGEMYEKKLKIVSALIGFVLLALISCVDTGRIAEREALDTWEVYIDQGILFAVQSEFDLATSGLVIFGR